jgi:hypothetical protein
MLDTTFKALLRWILGYDQTMFPSSYSPISNFDDILIKLVPDEEGLSGAARPKRKIDDFSSSSGYLMTRSIPLRFFR